MQRILVIGAGALGAGFIPRMINASNLLSLLLVDGDLVEKRNIKRLPGFVVDNDIGMPKVDVLKNKFERIETRNEFFSNSNAEALLRNRELVVDLADDLHLTRLLDEHCAQKRIPLLVASVYRKQGMVYILHQHESAPNFSALFNGRIGQQQDHCDMDLVTMVTINAVVERLLIRFTEIRESKDVNDALDLFDGKEWIEIRPAELTM